MELYDRTFFEWLGSYFQTFQWWLLQDTNGAWFLFLMVYLTFATIFTAVLYRRAKYRVYISEDIFETELDRIPTYMALLQAKELEKEKRKQASLKRLMEEDLLLEELRTGNRRNLMFRLKRWFKVNANDQRLVTLYAERKGEPKIEEPKTAVVSDGLPVMILKVSSLELGREVGRRERSLLQHPINKLGDN